MDCKDFEKQMSAYNSNMLSTGELAAFIEHLDECSDCREELAIHYLANEGLSRLEEGSAFDLRRIMEDQRERSIAKLRRRRFTRRVIYGLEALIALEIAAVVYLLVF